jgi:hypothetical protein
MPQPYVEAMGINLYPPGARQWDIVLPDLPAGLSEWKFIPGITCDGVAIDAAPLVAARPLGT